MPDWCQGSHFLAITLSYEAYPKRPPKRPGRDMGLGRAGLRRSPFRPHYSLGFLLVFSFSDSSGYWPFPLPQVTLVKLILLVPVLECQVVVRPERQKDPHPSTPAGSRLNLTHPPSHTALSLLPCLQKMVEGSRLTQVALPTEIEGVLDRLAQCPLQIQCLTLSPALGRLEEYVL